MSDQESDGLASLGQWRTFLAVHRAGSLTGAARSLGIAQSSITAHLQALEAALGRRLFERSARGVVPTPEADEIAGRLAGPLDAVAEVVATAVGPGGSGRSRAPVRLGGPAEFLAEVAMPALGPLVAGGLRLVVQPGLTDELLVDRGAHGSIWSSPPGVRAAGRWSPNRWPTRSSCSSRRPG
jgi:DNA-binding transcriptional LysR family regulator